MTAFFVIEIREGLALNCDSPSDKYLIRMFISPKTTFFVSLLIVSLAIAIPGALANTYYVSPGGADSNSGAIDAPFKTLAAAVTHLAPETSFIFAQAHTEKR